MCSGSREIPIRSYRCRIRIRRYAFEAIPVTRIPQFAGIYLMVFTAASPHSVIQLCHEIHVGSLSFDRQSGILREFFFDIPDHNDVIRVSALDHRTFIHSGICAPRDLHAIPLCKFSSNTGTLDFYKSRGGDRRPDRRLS